MGSPRSSSAGGGRGRSGGVQPVSVAGEQQPRLQRRAGRLGRSRDRRRQHVPRRAQRHPSLRAASRLADNRHKRRPMPGPRGGMLLLCRGRRARFCERSKVDCSADFVGPTRGWTRHRCRGWEEPGAGRAAQPRARIRGAGGCGVAHLRPAERTRCCQSGCRDSNHPSQLVCARSAVIAASGRARGGEAEVRRAGSIRAWDACCWWGGLCTQSESDAPAPTLGVLQAVALHHAGARQADGQCCSTGPRRWASSRTARGV
mmetsp:Transcript_45370/g.107602  ORF Transcript_45370/g.107602 Transcript_45370/m.107602 type:complete len:259 (-) Transcript_45370:135-911(-)